MVEAALEALSACDVARGKRARLWLEFLPAYAPELNPVEYLWSHWKLRNFGE